MKYFNKILFTLFLLLSLLYLSVDMFNTNAKLIESFDHNNLDITTYGTKLNPTISASLYYDSECLQLDQEITNSVALSNKWEFRTSRYLKIEISNMSEDTIYKLTVDLDKYLYANIKVLPNDENFSEITFTKNDSLTVNGSQKYGLKEYSGIFEYVTKKGYTSVSTVLEIRYDNVLWNKLANMNLVPEEGDILAIELEDDNNNLIERKALTQITTNKSLDYPFDCDLKTESASSYSNSIVYANSQDNIIFRLSTMTMETAHEASYYKELLIEIDVPKCGEYLMEYDISTFKFHSPSGVADYEYTYDDVNDKIILLLKDFYYTGKAILTAYFNFPAEMETATNAFNYVGKVKYILPNAGNSGEDINVSSYNYEIIMENKIEPKFSCYYLSSPKSDYRNVNAVQILGGYGLSNTGGSSKPLTISMSFNDSCTNNARVLVTTFRLMPDNITEYFKIEYTMIDKDGNPIWFDSNGNVVSEGTPNATREYFYYLNNSYKGKKLSTSGAIKFNRGMIDSRHQQYYFSSIKYTLQSIPENTTLWHASASSSYTSSNGTFWGYVVADKASKVTHTIKVFNENNDEITSLGKTLTSYIQLVESVSYGLKSVSLSKETITAGESIKVSGKAFVIDYPYSANNVLNVEGYNMRIGLSLPSGVSINSDSIIIKTEKKKELNVASVTSNEQSDGSILWIIEVEAERGDEIGYVSETLTKLSNGSTIDFSFDLITELYTAGINLSLKERMFFTAYKITNAANGSYSPYKTVDKYDLNGNGKTNDYIGAIGEADKSFQIIALTANLSIKDELRTSDNNQSSKNIELTSHDDYIYYDLSIICDSGGKADDFVYFIPIVNSDLLIDEMIKDNELSLVLKEQPVIYNSIVDNGVKISYTTVKNLSYSQVLTIDEWFTELPEGISWTDVTMIKVEAINDYISNGCESVISLKLSYPKTENDFIYETGKKGIWSSRGYYNYSIGSRMISGHFNTDENTISLKYTMPLQEFTLTAAKDRTPNNGGVVKYTLDNIPLFSDNQVYEITNIVTHNVGLLSKDYFIKYGSLMNGDDANRSFGFTVNINGGGEYDINSTLPLMIGEVGQNTKTEITFEIYNADVLSDITTIRYIEITIVGNNGVIIPIKINIERELTEVLASEKGITSGKQYRPFSTTNPAITISCDSALTAQFVGELLPNNYKARNIQFKESLKKGTTIVLVDWTDSECVSYYYYNVTSDINYIDLTDFIKMGSDNKTYINPVGNQVINEKLLFILDFENSNTIFENSITFNRVLQDDSLTSDKLSFTTDKTRSFEMSVDNSNVLLGEKIIINYSIGSLNYSDSKFNDNKLSLVLSATTDSYVPADTNITHDGKVYYANSNGEFIIPLVSSQSSGDYLVELMINSKTILSNYDSIKLNGCIWSSTNELQPFGGDIVTKDYEINITTNEMTSFKVVNMSNRYLSKDDLKENIVVTYETKNVSKLTLEVHQKVGDGYVLISTGINSINNNYSHTGGIFDINSSISTINIKFNEMMPKGLYKLVFRVYDEKGVEKDTILYSFLLIK